MKLNLLFLIITLTQVSASIKAQTVTINKQNAPITAVFEEIMKQTDYDFAYSEKQISKASRINISVTNASITEVLDKCFKDQPLTYLIKGKNVVIEAKKPSLFQRFVEKFSFIDVQGTIVDENGSPLVGASIKVKGGTSSASTDRQGRFFMQNVAEDAVLVISYIGYQAKEIPVLQNVGTIKLELTSGELQEIEINAGYYTVKEKERTGSISRVSAETIGKQPVSNPLAAMIGRMPGVNIEQQSGLNGGGFKVEIRGQNSLRNTNVSNGNLPLYLVDGVPFPSLPVTNSNIGVENFSINSSPLNYLNPADIASIEILKDADATAIYGSRGANGVVLIKTKTAKAGRTAVDLNMYAGVSQISKRIDMLNTAQYLEMRKEAMKNDVATPGNSDYDLNGTWDQNRYTDWQDVLIGGTAQTSNIQASISGGSDVTQFMVRGNWSRNTTVIPGDFSDIKGFGALNLNHTSTSQKFKAGFSTGYGIDVNTLPRFDLSKYITLPPNAPALYDEQGNLNWAVNSTGAATWENPVAILMVPYTGKTHSFISSGNLAMEIIGGLSVRANFGYTNIRNRENLITPIKSKVPATSVTGSNANAFSTNETLIFEPQINYQKSFGFGNINILLGSTFQIDEQQIERIMATGFTSDLTIQNISTAPSRLGSASSAEYRYNAIFGRLNYSVKGRYFINITGRRDGSSRFGTNRQFGNFGAAGIAWIFSEDRFMKSLPFLSFGKLRGSYGITGSDQIPNYGYLETYISTTYPYQDGSGLFPSRIANPNYSWETNKKLEAALELGFFNNRLLFNTAWYGNQSSNQLVGYTLPDIAGFPSIQYNLPATVRNTGWELEVNTINMKGKDFKWQSGINLTIPKNKLMEFPNISGSTYATTYTVGEALYTPRTFRYLGVNPETGIYIFEDFNGNGSELDAADRTVASKSLTSHLYGGLNNSLVFKNIQLEFFFQFVNKTSRYTSVLVPGNIGNQPTFVLERWQKPGDITDIQMFTAKNGLAGQKGSNMISSDNFMDTSFIRFKTLSLSWNAPQKIIQKLGCQQLRLYVQGQNLWTWTKYPGDPEVASFNALPSLRTLTGGMQVTF